MRIKSKYRNKDLREQCPREGEKEKEKEKESESETEKTT